MPSLSPTFKSDGLVETPFGKFIVDVFSHGASETLVFHTPDIPASVVTANPAIEGHLKTGHRAAART
jgi:hypothetical protein